MSDAKPTVTEGPQKPEKTASPQDQARPAGTTESRAQQRPTGPARDREDERRLLGELVKKAVTTGINTMLSTEEGVRAVVGAVAQKDIIGSAVSGVDATRKEAAAIVGREIGNFLQTLNLSEEITKILTSVSFEIRTEVRFVPNEEGKLRAKVSSGAKPKVTFGADEATGESGAGKPAQADLDPDEAAARAGTRKAARRAVRGIVERLAEATAATARAAAEVAADATADVINEVRGDDDEP